MSDNHDYDNQFHYSTTEYVPDYEGMAHEAALDYLKVNSHKMTATEYAKDYLVIYKEILAGLKDGSQE